jgi:hypothetical protein
VYSPSTRERCKSLKTGGLDGMVKRRIIRVLTVYSKTFYFTEQESEHEA